MNTVDFDERTVEVPAALAEVLDAEPMLRSKSDALARSVRKEHARSVADAKTEATGERRITKIGESLKI